MTTQSMLAAGVGVLLAFSPSAFAGDLQFREVVDGFSLPCDGVIRNSPPLALPPTAQVKQSLIVLDTWGFVADAWITPVDRWASMGQSHLINLSPGVWKRQVFQTVFAPDSVVVGLSGQVIIAMICTTLVGGTATMNVYAGVYFIVP